MRKGLRWIARVHSFLWITAISATAHGQAPVAFVHGINGHAIDWVNLGSELAGWANLEPSYPQLVSDNPIATQALQLHSAIENFAGGVPIILFTHSQGGLVARAASHITQGNAPIHAIITLSTPHSGAYIATRQGDIENMVFSAAIAAANVAWLTYPGGWLEPESEPWRLGIYATLQAGIWYAAIYYGGMIVAHRYIHGQAVLGDLDPSSNFIGGLNNQESLAAEQANVPIRIGLRVEADRFNCGGPLRLISRPETACAQSQDIHTIGVALLWRAIELSFAIDNEDGDSILKWFGIGSLVYLSGLAQTWEIQWCGHVGTPWCADPNDALVPVAAQWYPEAFFNDFFIGPSHDQESTWSADPEHLNLINHSLAALQYAATH